MVAGAISWLQSRTPAGSRCSAAMGNSSVWSGNPAVDLGSFAAFERLAAIPGDSILVFDRGNRRMAVIGPTLRVARTVPFGGIVHDAVRSRDGQFVVAALIETPHAFGHPYHVVGDSGLVRSFGATTETSQREAYVRNIRALASARAGGFWAGHLSRYEIDRADSTEQPTRAVVRSVSWFQPWTQSQDAAPWLVRPQPKLTAIREDQRGYIWTLVAVAHPRWKPMSAQNPSAGERLQTIPAIPDVNAIDEILERVVEVIDPRTGSVLASRRLPGSYGISSAMIRSTVCGKLPTARSRSLCFGCPCWTIAGDSERLTDDMRADHRLHARYAFEPVERDPSLE